MGYKVGMPVLKLDRQNHFGKDRRAGNARAVIQEAMGERRSSDPDIRREDTPNNLYGVPMEDGTILWVSGRELMEGDAVEGGEWIMSGSALADGYEQAAEEYRITDKHGTQKKLRSDAGIAFAGVVKPEMDCMAGMDRDSQVKFLKDSAEVVLKLYADRGMTVDRFVIHLDEGNPHMHYIGHDPEYKLGKKLGLPLYNKLNRAEYPKKMREKHWDIEDLRGYQEETAGMDDQELGEYKRKRRADRKGKHGKPSSVYKAEQKARAVSAAQEARERVLAEKGEEVRRKGLKAATSLQEAKKRQKELDAREAAINEREQKLEMLIRRGRQAGSQTGQELEHPERKGLDLDY